MPLQSFLYATVYCTTTQNQKQKSHKFSGSHCFTKVSTNLLPRCEWRPLAMWLNLPFQRWYPNHLPTSPASMDWALGERRPDPCPHKAHGLVYPHETSHRSQNTLPQLLTMAPSGSPQKHSPLSLDFRIQLKTQVLCFYFFPHSPFSHLLSTTVQCPLLWLVGGRSCVFIIFMQEISVGVNRPEGITQKEEYDAPASAALLSHHRKCVTWVCFVFSSPQWKRSAVWCSRSPEKGVCSVTRARDSYGDKGPVSGPQPFPLEDLCEQQHNHLFLKKRIWSSHFVLKYNTILVLFSSTNI